MKNKGQMTVGIVIMLFLTVLVGLIIFDASADEIGRATTLSPVVNASFTSGANGTATTIATGIKSVSSLVIYNYTNGTAGSGSDILAENTDYVITNNVVVNGAEVAQVTVYNSLAAASSWNLTYTGEPDTYVSSGGARAIVSLILVFMALAIAMISLSPTLRSNILKK